MNQISISFTPCDPTPANGYNILWRVRGSNDPLTDAGNFSESPAVFQDEVNPSGTCYEGFIRSDCSESGESGSNFGNLIPWETDCPGGGDGVAVADVRLNNVLDEHCDLSGVTVYTDDGTISEGKAVFYDIEMLLPVTGYDYISEISVGIVYNMNSGTGVVENATFIC